MAPVRTAVTEKLAAAVSLSVSLVRTLPVASLPAVAFATPPASTAVPLSSTPTGASLTGTSASVSVELWVPPLPSETV